MVCLALVTLYDVTVVIGSLSRSDRFVRRGPATNSDRAVNQHRRIDNNTTLVVSPFTTLTGGNGDGKDPSVR